MFKKMKLRHYLLTVFSLIIVLAVFLTVIGTIGLIQTKASLNELTTDILVAEKLVKACIIETNTAARVVGDIVNSFNEEDVLILKNQVSVSINNVKDNLIALKSKLGANNSLYIEYESAFYTWVDTANKAISEVESNNRHLARLTLLNESAPAIKELANKALEIESLTEKSSNEAQAKMSNRITIYMIVLFVTLGLVLLTSIFYAFRATNKINDALGKIKDAIEELTKGNLHANIDYVANNEFGELVEKINFSFQEILKYITAIDFGLAEFAKGNFNTDYSMEFIGDFASIKRSFEKFQTDMNSTLLELDMASDQVKSGADQVAQGSQLLAQGAEEQASSIEELSANISEISNKISQTADFSRIANDLGKQSGKVVSKSQSEMKQMMQAIKEIATASENIQRIIKAIDDIAFQTNILALNAAVEAARAGAAGKGFAVVADEVRNLAQKSADAARDTSDLIENSMRSVAHGEKLANNTNKAFGEVAKVSDQILEIIEKIATSSNEQASYITQISESVDQISYVVQTNSATSQESAAASEELSAQAANMKSLINNFNLNRDAAGYVRSNEYTINSNYTNNNYSNNSEYSEDFNYSDDLEDIESLEGIEFNGDFEDIEDIEDFENLEFNENE